MKTAIRKKPISAAAKKRNTKILGASVLAFAVVGVITVISLVVGLIAQIFDDSDQRAKFEQFISPVVMVDPVAFDNISKADEHVLLMSSMWNLLTNVSDATSYPEDEYGMMIIPSSDLDVSAASLFGSEASLSHQTFGNSSINFEFNEESSSYIVPPMGYSMQYQPRVDKIKRKGKTYTLTVSYISTTTNIGASNEEAEADKTMYYVLTKTGRDKYIISAVLDSQDSEQTEITSSAAQSDITVSSGISQTETESDIASSETQSQQ